MKHKSIFSLFIAVLFLFSCSNTEKLIRKGQFDRAFQVSLHRVIRHPDKAKEVNSLISAYNKAQQRDNDYIIKLRKQGTPDIWDNVFDAYRRMDSRQNQIKPVLPLKINGQTQNVPLVDYQNEIVEAQKKAAEYYYVHGKSLLKSNNKDKARQAYYEFQKTKKYYANYKDVNDLINEAYTKGIRHVSIFVENKSLVNFSNFLNDELSKKLLDLNTPSFNSKWVQFHTYIKNPPEQDYSVIIQFEKLFATPGSTNQKSYNKEKEIQNGWQYVLDNNGNVMKDSLGNDIKVPKIEKIFCNVTEVHLHKEAHVAGKIVFYDNVHHQELKYLPVGADQVFDYVYATANGDLRALDEATKKLINKKPMAFPPTPVMINDAFNTLKIAINNGIGKNKGIFR